MLVRRPSTTAARPKAACTDVRRTQQADDYTSACRPRRRGEQIAAAGWRHRTVRGAIFGALKKTLGLIGEAARTREVGPDKNRAKGSTTVYRVIEAR
jgi:hypothetical protein